MCTRLLKGDKIDFVYEGGKRERGKFEGRHLASSSTKEEETGSDHILATLLNHRGWFHCNIFISINELIKDISPIPLTKHFTEQYPSNGDVVLIQAWRIYREAHEIWDNDEQCSR